MSYVRELPHQLPKTRRDPKTTPRWKLEGPRPEDYRRVESMARDLILEHARESKLSRDHLERIHQRLLGNALSTPETLLGFCFSKPHGYAGDFEIIDRIYTGHLSRDPRARRWDQFFHTQSAPKAVRNRKSYFKRLLKEKARRHTGVLRVLNLASGPARDLKEFFEENPDLVDRVHVHCVELDEDAIAFAKELLGPLGRNVHFEQANVFRFRSAKTYDLVWSAGLFDYFEDRAFVRVLRRLTRNVRAGGEIVIGNFHPRNPSLPLMILQDWILHHRTEDELLDLARQAAGEDITARVEQESEGVNLFLRWQP